MKKIVWILVPIITTIIGVYVISNSLSNLQKIDREIDEARPIFVSGFLERLEYCTTPHPDAVDQEAILKSCKESIQFYMSECDFYGNPDVCKDSRIAQILSTK